MSQLHDSIHNLATIADVKLTDPKPVDEAFARQQRWAELRAEPTLPSLDRVLTATPVARWDKTIADHSVAVARQTEIRASGTHTFDAAIDSTIRANIDDYLAVLAPAVDAAAERMTTAASSMTTLDSNESVLRNEGHFLHAYVTAHALIGAYAALCAQVVRSLKSQEPGGRTVHGELGIIDCGQVPIELIARDNLARPTTNPPTERAHIDATRKALRAPRTTIGELISDVAFGQAHPEFKIAIPASRADIDTHLARWDAANRQAYTS